MNSHKTEDLFTSVINWFWLVFGVNHPTVKHAEFLTNFAIGVF